MGGAAASVTGDRGPGRVRLGVRCAPGPDGGGPVAAIIDLDDQPTGYQVG